MKSYRICQTRVVYEVLNTEVIAVDFSTGNYYALIHTAKQVWQLIEKSVPMEEIGAFLSRSYGRDQDVVLRDLHQFFKELFDNGLIEPTDEAGTIDPALESPQGWEYDAPQLQKYTDVQSLLLLDPIHDVAEVGWPAKHEG